jgi:lipoic acid synthetase
MCASETKKVCDEHAVYTVCSEARCPNIMECYQQKRATFLLLGPACTRSCAFCAVSHTLSPSLPDVTEPVRVAECIEKLQLRYVVLTMVTRDDLEDGGASHVVATLRSVKKLSPHIECELLVSDFQGKKESVSAILEERPEVFAHNIETVQRLSSKVRHKASYERSLELLRYVKEQFPGQTTKSGLMVGLGESDDEVCTTFDDLAAAQVDIVTVGQYLQATPSQIPVVRTVSPQLFAEFKHQALCRGIRSAICGPFVRSSSPISVAI